MEAITIISKEEVPQYHFVHEDVLTTQELKRDRYRLLEKAALLGNGYHGKVKIIFETTEGTKAVETTIWQASEDQISLKGGINIPIHAVREIVM